MVGGIGEPKIGARAVVSEAVKRASGAVSSISPVARWMGGSRRHCWAPGAAAAAAAVCIACGVGSGAARRQGHQLAIVHLLLDSVDRANRCARVR
jgi:hypothetical protein